MGGQPLGWGALAGCAHFLPQAHARPGVKAGAGSQLHAHQVGFALVFAAEFERQQLGALLRHGYTLHKDPRYPHSERRTVKDSAGVVVLDDAPLDAVCDFCKRNGLYLPE